MAKPTDLNALTQWLLARSAKQRTIVAIAGAPGSGKSTLADQLATDVNAAAPGRAAVLPMDGFHFDDILLTELGLLERKGADNTFDVGGLIHTLGRLRANAEISIAVPIFDRTIEIARAGARLIPNTTDVIIAEGNYLLLRPAPWDGLQEYFDASVMITCPEETLRNRLKRRWEGYNLSADEIRSKLDGNDMLNCRNVMANSLPATFEYPSE